MRNGGYKGINDPTLIDNTRGIHNTRDQLELTKRFGNAWYQPQVSVYIDSTIAGTNGTVTSSSTSNGEFDISTTQGTATRIWSNVLPYGKRYFEVELLTSSSTASARYLMVGILWNGFTGNYATGNANIFYQANGSFYPGAANSGLGAFVTFPEILKIAYDTDTGKYWFNANDVWSLQSGNPGSGGAGITINGWASQGTGGAYGLFFNHGSGATVGYTGRILTGGSLTSSPPSGFTSA